MEIVHTFLTWWLRKGRYPWSRFIRNSLERNNAGQPLPSAQSVDEVESLLKQVTWKIDPFFHLYDSISLPETVWNKKRDDCDGFAILAAALLKKLDPSTNPKLVTIMLHPVKESHTICVFYQDGNLRFFDNSNLNMGTYQNYEDVVNQVQKRGKRLICWDVVDPESLQTQEFHT